MLKLRGEAKGESAGAQSASMRSGGPLGAPAFGRRAAVAQTRIIWCLTKELKHSSSITSILITSHIHQKGLPLNTSLLDGRTPGPARRGRAAGRLRHTALCGLHLFMTHMSSVIASGWLGGSVRVLVLYWYWY